jgi:hypothetical protein
VRRGSLVLLLALAATTSCLDGSAPGPDCSGNLEVSVGTGLTPEIGWRPFCLAMGLVVESADGSGPIWIVNTADWIAPPVTYGTMPRGTVGTEAHPLVTGGRYRVLVEALVDVPGVGNRAGIVGSAEFTP